MPGRRFKAPPRNAAVLVERLPLPTSRGMDRLLQHIAACNSARLPGTRRPLRIGEACVGYVAPRAADALAAFPVIRRDGTALVLTDPAALPGIVRALAECGLLRCRGETFDVRADPDGPALAQADRGALPLLGIMSVGVHVNGLVHAADGLRIWVGVRAASRHLDPGKLDHLIAGGVPAGLTPEATLIKEAAEEADIPPAIARRAVPVARIAYAIERPEGLRRDLLLCYDLDMPAGFDPRPVDGEVARFELWPAAQVLATMRAGDAFKFNVNLALIDLFIRCDLIGGAEAARLRTALDSPAPGAPGVPAEDTGDAARARA